MLSLAAVTNITITLAIVIAMIFAFFEPIWFSVHYN